MTFKERFGKYIPEPKYHKGDILIGDKNHCRYEVLGVQGTNYILKDLKTEKSLVYGINALHHCALSLEKSEA